MKAQLVTITATAIVPDGHLPEGITLPDFAYRVCCGLMSLESLRFKARPATREEADRNADFLREWSMNLAAWEYAQQSDNLPATRRAENFGKSMRIEADDAPALSWRSALQLIQTIGHQRGGEWCAEQARAALEAIRGDGVNTPRPGGEG